MQATIVLNNIRLTLDDNPDTNILDHPVDGEDARRILSVIKNYGMDTEEADSEMADVAFELARSHQLGDAPGDSHWGIAFDTWVSIDGTGISWEEL